MTRIRTVNNRRRQKQLREREPWMRYSRSGRARGLFIDDPRWSDNGSDPAELVKGYIAKMMGVPPQLLVERPAETLAESVQRDVDRLARKVRFDIMTKGIFIADIVGKRS